MVKKTNCSSSSAIKLVGSLELVAISHCLASSPHSSFQVGLNHTHMEVFLGVIPILWSSSSSRECSKHSIQVGLNNPSMRVFLVVSLTTITMVYRAASDIFVNFSLSWNWIESASHNFLSGLPGLLHLLYHWIIIFIPIYILTFLLIDILIFSGFLGLLLTLQHCSVSHVFEYIPSMRLTKR